MSFPPSQLWIPHQYNPVAPQSSYDKLRDDVQETLGEKVCQKLQQQLENEQKTVIGTLQSPLLSTLLLTDQTQLRENGDELNKQLQSLRTQLDDAIQQVGDKAVVNDFPEDDNGRFQALLRSLRSIYETLKGISQQTKKLSAHLTSLELTTDEKTVYQALMNDPKDVATLRQQNPKLN